MTLEEGLRRGEAELRAGPHPERARLDAELLMLHVAGCGRATLLAHGDEELDAGQAELYDALITRRRNGEPIQYILCQTEFYGLPFAVTRDVLIPRPETEHLVEKVLELAMRFREPRIVDVGTGSGAIAVSLVHKLPGAQLVATDLSAAALDLARANAERNGVAGRIRFLCGDLLAPAAEERFDIVASNPPYVPSSDRASLAVEVREYEPALALFAGGDGLDVYRRLIPAAYAALVPWGFLALEIGCGQSSAIAGLLADSGFEQIGFTSDLQGIPRVACALRP